MPKLIQSQARGVLSLLTSKDGGLGPAAMEDNLRLTLEMLPFYGLNGRQVLFRGQTAAQLDNAATGWLASGGATVRGWFACMNQVGPPLPPPAGNDIIVPEGELWRVLNVTMHFNRTVGSGGSLAAGWAHGLFPAFRFAQNSGQVSGTVGAGFHGTAGGDCDFIALPGTTPAFFVPQFTLATLAFDLNVYLTYERIPL